MPKRLPKFFNCVIINKEYLGFFIFPKEILAQQNIIKTFNGKGKMSFRLYTKFEKELNLMAIRAQKWQITYFIDKNKPEDEEKLNKILKGERI